MNQTEIFGPVLAMFFLTMVVWIYMFSRRIPFITSNNLQAEQLTPSELARLSPPEVSTPSDNLKNLFEIPVVFYVLALYLFATSQVDATYVAASWVFVFFRVLHSAVHCTFNQITTRFGLYLVAGVSVWFMVIRAGLAHFVS